MQGVLLVSARVVSTTSGIISFRLLVSPPFVLIATFTFTSEPVNRSQPH